jgi:predicted nucleic acid-binding protein
VTFVVDTNILSEPTKKLPAPTVIDWLREHETDLVVTPIVLGELEFGILSMPAGRWRTSLMRWFADVISRLRVLELDRDTARVWAGLLASLRRKGRSMPFKDSLVAASALQYDFTIATRNTDDYRNAGVRVVNPFEN